MADEAILDQLRQVFDLCDEERCGYITSDKLRQLGREHFAGSEQVSQLGRFKQMRSSSQFQ
ncbi:hypothetical protein HPB52_005973 [Rhipicephalus sanguineus]|uniref:EF-hand domain-containing protein n=1 Tax=Rhipicephalus sanguineus TaxID=34632 RepID=A0A9D4PJ12_RHISA|nr:hypothetical protein HPB52_005973 [Rhipicephalus sanguineus]